MIFVFFFCLIETEWSFCRTAFLLPKFYNGGGMDFGRGVTYI